MYASCELNCLHILLPELDQGRMQVLKLQAKFPSLFKSQIALRSLMKKGVILP